MSGGSEGDNENPASLIADFRADKNQNPEPPAYKPGADRTNLSAVSFGLLQ